MIQHGRALVIVLLALVALPACSPSSSSSEASTSEETISSAECEEPSNPWAGDGGGHDAGFEWAQETGDECPSDHGASFEEGCTDFHDQQSRYEECEAAK